MLFKVFYQKIKNRKMKRTLLFLNILFLIISVSCKSDDTQNDPTDEPIYQELDIITGLDFFDENLNYAEINDVLIITSSGNDSFDLDKVENYPNDSENYDNEFVKNFIKVGNTSYRLDSMLVHSTSNYGKREVDLFAPGTRILCLTRRQATTDTGTSLSSAVVTGVATLMASFAISSTDPRVIVLGDSTHSESFGMATQSAASAIRGLGIFVEFPLA